MSREFIFLGAGGHASVIKEIVEILGGAIRGYISMDSTKNPSFQNVERLNSNLILKQFKPENYFMINAVGSVGIDKKRMNLQKKYMKLGYRFPVIAHPSAIVSKSVELGAGCQIMAGAIVQANCKIGEGAILNSRSSVDHDCVIGDYVHIAPGVILSGNVKIGECSLVGAGATIIQGVSAGKGVTIAAGSVVIQDIQDGVRVKGVPSNAF